jgi:hypothetical protein
MGSQMTSFMFVTDAVSSKMIDEPNLTVLFGFDRLGCISWTRIGEQACEDQSDEVVQIRHLRH